MWFSIEATSTLRSLWGAGDESDATGLSPLPKTWEVVVEGGTVADDRLSHQAWRVLHALVAPILAEDLYR